MIGFPHFNPASRNGTAFDAPHFRQVDTISRRRLPTVFNSCLNSGEACNSIQIFSSKDDDETLSRDRHLVEMTGAGLSYGQVRRQGSLRPPR